jgi:hypothetical protein
MVQPEKQPERHVYFRGALLTIEYGIGLNGKKLAKEFFDDLISGKDMPIKSGKKAQTKLKVLFEQKANDGRVPNPSRYSKEDKVIEAFK